MTAEEYIKLQEAIITHAKESWSGDYKKANKCFKTYTRRICELINAEGINIIYDLLKSDNLEKGCGRNKRKRRSGSIICHVYGK